MNKEERYDVLYRQIDSLIAGEENLVGVLANVSSAMKEQFPSEYFWVGFYLVRYLMAKVCAGRHGHKAIPLSLPMLTPFQGI